MSSHLSEPGEMIEETIASAFSAVPEVPVSKRTIRRTARLGKARPEASGVLPLLSSLTHSLRAWKTWKDDMPSTPTSLKNAFQMGHRGRALVLENRVQQPDGTFVSTGSFSSGPGYSSSQKTQWWAGFVDLSPTRREYRVSVRYPGQDRPNTFPTGIYALTDISVEVLGGTATVVSTSAGTGASAGYIEFVLDNPDSQPEIVLRIRAVEDRTYSPTGLITSNLSGSPARLDMTVVAEMS
jgi:hypothetical protein